MSYCGSHTVVALRSNCSRVVFRRSAVAGNVSWYHCHSRCVSAQSVRALCRKHIVFLCNILHWSLSLSISVFLCVCVSVCLWIVRYVVLKARTVHVFGNTEFTYSIRSSSIVSATRIRAAACGLFRTKLCGQISMELFESIADVTRTKWLTFDNDRGRAGLIALDQM